MPVGAVLPTLLQMYLIFIHNRYKHTACSSFVNVTKLYLILIHSKYKHASYVSFTIITEDIPHLYSWQVKAYNLQQFCKHL